MKTLEQLMMIGEIDQKDSSINYTLFLKIEDNILVSPIIGNKSHLFSINEELFEFINNKYSTSINIIHLSEEGAKIFANVEIVKKHIAKLKTMLTD